MIEWINIKDEKPPLDKIISAKFKIDIPWRNIYIGDIKQTKLILSDEAGGLVLKLDITNDEPGFGTLADISHWLKKSDEPIDSRFELLDL